MLPLAKVENVGMVVLRVVSVALLLTLTVPLNAAVDGILKVVAVLPLPTTTCEPAPLTVQAALMVPKLVLVIMYVHPALVKLAGDVPVPLVLVPQVPKVFKLPVDFE